MNKYTIGTRGSLLALTQCTQVKEELERITGDSFELKIIKTQGDQITDKPLWQLEGKDFFTKELDAALLTGDVDLVVHSYKDLGSERPEGISLAAITKRSYSEDILLIKNSTIKELKNKDEFIVGTSSPRRITNIERKLAQFIPAKPDVLVKTKILRGNINTRIEKLRNDEYDAIVLALAGVERLALSNESLITLKELLKDLNFMVLPQSVFPAAASQGALAIEYNENRDDNNTLLKKLELMNDKDTISEVKRERHAFKSYGGGCHLAVGINVRKHLDYYLHTHEGKVDDKVISESSLEGAFPSVSNKGSAFIGLPLSKAKLSFKELTNNKNIRFCELIDKKEVEIESNLEGEFFIASNYGLSNILKLKGVIYSAGIKTWKTIVRNGIWVNASADSLGEEEILRIRNSKAIKVMRDQAYESNAGDSLYLLSHKDSKSDNFEVIPVYKREIAELSQDTQRSILEIQNFYWTSFTQYLDYTSRFPQIKDRAHFCGLGKTLSQFIENDVSARPTASIDEFLQLCDIKE